MRKTSGPKWLFSAHFRKHVYGWRSSPLAVQRVKEAVGEIKRVALQDPLRGGEGAVLFLEKVSQALEQVDSSTGAIGNAVNWAIEDLVPIIVAAPADDRLRDRWLRRLETAIQADDIPYIELLPDYWGELCVTSERASQWADEFMGIVRLSWGPDPEMRGFFKFTTACLSALLRANRFEELLSLLEKEPHKLWHYRKWGVKALLAMGNKAEALRYAENSGALNDSPIAIARACEEILLSSGMVDEAYRRYALPANQSPCDPKTLTRASLETASKVPGFALPAGLAALRWLVEGYGYEVTGLDVRRAFEATLQAADLAGCREATLEHIRQLIAQGGPGAKFVAESLGSRLN